VGILQAGADELIRLQLISPILGHQPHKRR